MTLYHSPTSIIHTEVAIGCHPSTGTIWAPPPRCASSRSASVRANLAASAKGVLIGPLHMSIIS